METHEYNISIPPDPQSGTPSVNAQLGRINVILGSNGTGKSRVLRILRDSHATFGNRTPVYIEGGRVIVVPTALNLDHNTYQTFGTYTRAQSTFKSRRMSSLMSRASDAFFLLERRGQQNKITHSDAVVAWQASGSTAPCPTLPEDPLQALFRMFSEVFPEIKLSIGSEDNNRMIQCQKNGGQPYPPTQLSDGERQVLFILADIAQSAESRSLIVADEPELNLHPLLANRLWSNIERQLPECVFIYGTHSIGFAMRSAIDAIVALKSGGRPALEIKSVHDLDRGEAREFLGAIPSILAANSALVVEGDDDSFDGPFYRWVVGDKDVATVPIGGSSDVTAATRRSGMWQKLGSDVRIAGVIDRDFKTIDEQRDLSSSCVILEYHEAESYLCHPTLAARLANSLGTAAVIPTEADIKTIIKSYFAENLLRIASTRTISRASLRLNVSLRAAEMRAARTEEALRLALMEAASEEASKAPQVVGSEAVARIFDEELEICRSALSNLDIEKILTLAPGKELLPRIAPGLGCKDSAAVARAAFKHLDAASFPHLAALRSRIKGALSLE